MASSYAFVCYGVASPQPLVTCAVCWVQHAQMSLHSAGGRGSDRFRHPVPFRNTCLDRTMKVCAFLAVRERCPGHLAPRPTIAPLSRSNPLRFSQSAKPFWHASACIGLPAGFHINAVINTHFVTCRLLYRAMTLWKRWLIVSWPVTWEHLNN
jgi:hypothetical protein